MSSTKARVALFVAIVVVCGAIGVAYVVHASGNDPKSGKATLPYTFDTAKLADYMSAPHVVFRSTDLGQAYGHAVVTPLSDTSDIRAVTALSCDRVDMTGDIGICLHTNQGVLTTYEGEIFDAHFHVLHTFPLPGLPSRARVSPDGHWVAMTTFVKGDSYAGTNFSTRTQFVDTATGKIAVTNLEQFAVTNNGAPVSAISRNYWGVTFTADSNHFYATLDVNYSDIHLIYGDLATRTAKTIAPDVECPSLSPDQTRIAYKKRVGGTLSAVKWRLHVLTLATGKDVELAETHSVDDQVEWLNNSTVLYALPRSLSGSVAYDTYEVPADGTGQASKYLKGAQSPSVAHLS